MVSNKLWITITLVVLSQYVHAEEDESTTAAPSDGPDEALNCFQCNATDTCSDEQNKENGTYVDCGDKHCWTWKTEDGDNVTYRRDCGDVCTDETKELDCKTSNNRTECAKCCSDAYCNDGLLNAGYRITVKMTLLLSFLPTTLFVFL